VVACLKTFLAGAAFYPVRNLMKGVALPQAVAVRS
jgi:hypothetical protein